MAIKRHKRGDKVYIAEYKNVREGNKVKSIFIRYLGEESQIKAGKKPKQRILDRLDLSRSSRAGDVRLLWQIAEDLDFVDIIDRICYQKSGVSGPSPGKFLTVWAINRVLDPDSCTKLERWVPTTDLPILTGISPDLFKKGTFLSSLDFVCCHDRTSNRLVDNTAAIDDMVYLRWRHDHPLPPGEKETVAYDITSVLFFGVTCPLAELGHNAKRIKRRQVNLALLVSKHDKYPLAHFVYNGSRNDSSTVKNLIARLNDLSIDPGTIIWDRGNVSREYVKMVELAEWKLICGVPKTSNEVRDIMNDTKVQVGPRTFVHKSRTGYIYATKSNKQLFGRKRSVIVYVNQDRRIKKINTLNEALAEISKELDDLKENGKEWSEAKLHKNIDAIVGKWKDYIHTRVKRKDRGPRIEWRYKAKEIKRAEDSYAKYLLLSTDETLSTEDVVKAYFEKDFIEKVFRTFKTEEEMEPVRHHLEHRVRAYMFVCVLAYRILSALRFKIEEAIGKEGAWGQTVDLLYDLARVERTEVKFGKEVKTLYLNLPNSIKKTLKKIGMEDLLIEEVRLKV